MPWLRRFYFGNGDGDARPGLKAMVTERLDEIDAREVNSIPLGADADGRDDRRPGRAATGRTCPARRGHARRSPRTSPPTSSPSSKAAELLAAPSGDRVLGHRPRRPGCPCIAQAGRFGPYVQLGDADGGGQDEAPDGVAVQDA